MTTADLDLEDERRRLFGLAYRMIGEVAEAEDAVQDALARWAAADQEAIRAPAAWLTTVTTRTCIDRLTSARKRLFVLHVERDRIAGIQAVRNPDKLAHVAAKVERS